MPPPNELQASQNLDALRAEMDQLKAEYARLVVEKNFLERATEHLNFHNNAHDGVVYTDGQNRIVYANPYFLEMLGISNPNELLNQPFPDYMWNNDSESERLFKDVSQNGFVRERELALYNKAGEPVFAMCSGVASHDENGDVLGTEIMFCNITSKRMVQAELMQQNALLDAMLLSTPDPTLVLTGEMLIERATPAAQQLLNAKDKASAKDVYKLLDAVGLGEQVPELQQLFGTQQQFAQELELNGKYYEMHAAPLQSKQRGWVCVLHDITERKRTEQNLQYHAYHDMLTQLPNRAYFLEKMERMIARINKGDQSSFAVLFIDLDKLKSVNDSFGHHVGDQFLIEFSRRLEACVRPGDLVGRLGGDEFAVFLDQIADEEAALNITERVHKALRKSFNLLDQHKVQTSASIGIAIFDQSINSADELMRKADKAMYKAKSQGGDTFRL